MTARDEGAARVRSLNDQMRANGLGGGPSERWVITSGVQALSAHAASEAVRLVRAFSSFDDGNDPYGEHDFGSITVADQAVFWKIDYYDRTLSEGSPDPSDPEVTCRVLTIMLASEY